MKLTEQLIVRKKLIKANINKIVFVQQSAKTAKYVNIIDYPHFRDQL